MDDNGSYLRVVTNMEGAVCNSHQGPDLGVMSVLAITLKEAQSCNEVSLLQEVSCIWQS